VIFVDTSFFIGSADPADDRHAEVVALLQARPGVRLVTSNHVLGETWTFLRRRRNHRAAMRFVEQVEEAAEVEVVFVTLELEREAWAWLRRHDESPYSFVDATSFALMRHLRIGQAFSFDGDFAAAGFAVLRA
jgi:predicted nucleic acid-binding protein